MKYKILFVVFIFSMFLTSCWDSAQINDKVFVSLIGIDLGKDINNEEIENFKPTDPFIPFDIERYNVIFSYPEIGKFNLQSKSQLTNKTLEVKSNSLDDALNDAMDVSSRQISFEQTRFILFSEDFFKNKQYFKEIVASLLKNPTVSNGSHIGVCDGSAENFIKFKPPEYENNIQNYIEGIIRNMYVNTKTQDITLINFIRSTYEHDVYLLPKITISESGKELKVNGFYVVKDFEQVDELSLLEAANIGFMNKSLNNLLKNTFIDNHSYLFNLESTKNKMKILSKKGDEKLKVSIDISAYAIVNGGYYDDMILEEDSINKLEKNLSEATTTQLNQVVKNMQMETGIDLLLIKSKLQKFHPTLWKEYSKNWDEVLKNAEINVNLECSIKNRGALK